jgi:hypothetical protein
VAVKVRSVEGWQSFDSKSAVLQLLVQSRGGLSNERCIWAGCSGRAVQGVAYCPKHLYETGARK